MRRVFLLLCAGVCPALGHMVSISTGDITLSGTRGKYEFRMPLYEIAHVQEPEKVLRHAVQFSSGGQEARQKSFGCRKDDSENALICTAEYEFAQPVEILAARSTFHTLTVPNHVHLLRAVMDGKSDQAVLDLSFPQAELRFRPPTALETATKESVGGALRAIGGAAQWLFLGALVMAARSRRELLLLTAMFIVGEALVCFAVPMTSWRPAPRFVEAAAALTIAYLAIELLLLPEAGQRWAVVGVLGIFHGLYFLLFLESSNYSAGWVLTGVAVAEIAVIGVLAAIWPRLLRPLKSLQPVRVLSGVLFMVGLGWFFLRLRS
ncbi:MAG: HupE/UreJ family protein [Bryobacterales bacterium]|nr:HupE/UreJ family protein [Bryobacterales bacterium]